MTTPVTPSTSNLNPINGSAPLLPPTSMSPPKPVTGRIQRAKKGSTSNKVIRANSTISRVSSTSTASRANRTVSRTNSAGIDTRANTQIIDAIPPRFHPAPSGTAGGLAPPIPRPHSNPTASQISRRAAINATNTPQAASQMSIALMSLVDAASSTSNNTTGTLSSVSSSSLTHLSSPSKATSVPAKRTAPASRPPHPSPLARYTIKAPPISAVPAIFNAPDAQTFSSLMQPFSSPSLNIAHSSSTFSSSTRFGTQTPSLQHLPIPISSTSSSTILSSSAPSLSSDVDASSSSPDTDQAFNQWRADRISYHNQQMLNAINAINHIKLMTNQARKNQSEANRLNKEYIAIMEECKKLSQISYPEITEFETLQKKLADLIEKRNTLESQKLEAKNRQDIIFYEQLSATDDVTTKKLVDESNQLLEKNSKLEEDLKNLESKITETRGDIFNKSQIAGKKRKDQKDAQDKINELTLKGKKILIEQISLSPILPQPINKSDVWYNSREASLDIIIQNFTTLFNQPFTTHLIAPNTTTHTNSQTNEVAGRASLISPSINSSSSSSSIITPLLSPSTHATSSTSSISSLISSIQSGSLATLSSQPVSSSITSTATPSSSNSSSPSFRSPSPSLISSLSSPQSISSSSSTLLTTAPAGTPSSSIFSSPSFRSPISSSLISSLSSPQSVSSSSSTLLTTSPAGSSSSSSVVTGNRQPKTSKTKKPILPPTITSTAPSSNAPTPKRSQPAPTLVKSPTTSSSSSSSSTLIQGTSDTTKRNNNAGVPAISSSSKSATPSRKSKGVKPPLWVREKLALGDYLGTPGENNVEFSSPPGQKTTRKRKETSSSSSAPTPTAARSTAPAGLDEAGDDAAPVKRAKKSTKHSSKTDKSNSKKASKEFETKVQAEEETVELASMDEKRLFEETPEISEQEAALNYLRSKDFSKEPVHLAIIEDEDLNLEKLKKILADNNMNRTAFVTSRVHGRTALELLVMCQHTDILAELDNIFPTEKGRIKDVNFDNWNAMQLLATSDYLNNPEVIKIIKQFKKIGFRFTRPQAKPPLHLAAHYNHAHILKAMLEVSKNKWVNKRNAQTYAPIHYAILQSQKKAGTENSNRPEDYDVPDVVKVLVAAKGADLTIKTKDLGQNILMFAAEICSACTVEMLLRMKKNGKPLIDLSKKDFNGKTALDIARNGYYKTEQLCGYMEGTENHELHRKAVIDLLVKHNAPGEPIKSPGDKK